MSQRLRGVFWFGGHCCPDEGRSARTRRSIAPLIQTGSDRARGTFAPSVITRGGRRSFVPDLQTLPFLALSRDRRSASLPKACRSSSKSPMLSTRSPQAIPRTSSWLRNLMEALRPAASLSVAIQTRLTPGVGMKRPRWAAVRQEARSNSGRAMPTERVLSRPSPTMRSERAMPDQKRMAWPWSCPRIRFGHAISAILPLDGSRCKRAHPVIWPRLSVILACRAGVFCG
ncbi:hypothetical protein LA6_005910 (plasmid) [Marinibacterium anthonyi]|nr:hypothetical protein LA6_005910 [Marinibacterium anthonyi]